MKFNLLSFLKGMSPIMYGSVIATIALSAYVVFTMESGRRLPYDYDDIQFKIQDLHESISQLSTAPVLEKRESVWRDVKAMASLHGVTFKSEEGEEGEEGSVYEGPLKSWRASLSGEPKSVFALAALAQKHHPVYLLDYKIAAGEAKLILAIVGE